MSEIIEFPNKVENTETNNINDTIEFVRDAIANGKTNADTIVVVWGTETGDNVVVNYKFGGDGGLMTAIGLLELAKSMMAE